MGFVLGVGVLSLAALTFAGDVQIHLKAEKAQPGASGTATMSGKDLSIQAKGLRPDSVYTVWFVDMKPKKKVGIQHLLAKNAGFS